MSIFEEFLVAAYTFSQIPSIDKFSKIETRKIPKKFELKNYGRNFEKFSVPFFRIMKNSPYMDHLDNKDIYKCKQNTKYIT